jgi:hypothetical protein
MPLLLDVPGGRAASAVCAAGLGKPDPGGESRHQCAAVKSPFAEDERSDKTHIPECQLDSDRHGDAHQQTENEQLPRLVHPDTLEEHAGTRRRENV